MDTDKIINNIIDQSNVNELKNELINLKGYLNTIDVKITSLKNEEKEVSNELEDAIDSILDLKEEILNDCNNKYEKLLEELINEKKIKSQIHIDSMNTYEKYIKMRFRSKEMEKELETNEKNAEKEYEESVLKENEFKKKYEKEIQVFLHVILTFLEDKNRENVFDRVEKNPFEFYKTLEYFDANLLEKLILLFETRENLIRKYISIKKQLNSTTNEKNDVTYRIKELDLKVSILLKEREMCIDDIKNVVGKTADVVEKGVKSASKIGKFAYNFVKDKVINNIPLEDEITEEQNVEDNIPETKQQDSKFRPIEIIEETKDDFKSKVLEAAVEGAINESKKRVKSFFKNLKDNK